MNWSTRIFKVRGIEIKVHLTFVLILAWAAYRWSGATGAGLQGALFGVVATLLLFAAVTLHELGHSFQAMKFGVRVREITLMPMGGLAQMEEIPEKPDQELRIAIAGPLVNFAIAGVLILVGSLLQVRSVISISELIQSFGKVSWSGMLAYLTMANLALAVFNLIPAFPMDGGRILRALLAMKLDYSRATSIAVTVGQGLAWLIGIWGLLTGSYTLVLIAIFVWMGAGQEGRTTVVKDALRDIRVGQAMTSAPQTLKANEPLSKAAELTLSTAQSDFPVIEWGTNKVVGMMSESDLLRGLQKHARETPVRDVMQVRIPAIETNEPLYQALEKMAKSKARAVPVVDRDGQLAGLLTTTDVNEAYRLFSLGQEAAPVAG
jgi:Zn-dependent protease/CBS domain-containing protein